MINAGNITFNTTTATENDNVTIHARVWNIGSTDAGSFDVQFYYGDPDNGGTQIGNDLTVSGLAKNSSIVLNKSYVVPIGVNDFYVIVDPPLSSNGSIQEDNESNNKAYNSITVGLWEFLSGNTSDGLVIEDLSDIAIFDWLVANSTGSNLIAADTEAVLEFGNLTALSRDVVSAYQPEDFYELDVAIGSENLTDSVNATYTSNNNPKSTSSFVVLGKTITNVPVVNSTNNSNFQTGILWDSGDGGSEYDGTQDVAFISEIKKQRMGKNGIVDYEIRIPALLRQMDNTESTSVYLYTEIK